MDALTNASGRLVVSTVLASRPPVEVALLFVVVSLPSLSGLLAAGRPADRNRPVRPARGVRGGIGRGLTTLAGPRGADPAEASLRLVTLLTFGHEINS